MKFAEKNGLNKNILIENNIQGLLRHYWKSYINQNEKNKLENQMTLVRNNALNKEIEDELQKKLGLINDELKQGKSIIKDHILNFKIRYILVN